MTLRTLTFKDIAAGGGVIGLEDGTARVILAAERTG